MNIHEFKKSVSGKKIDVIGIGISNKPLIRLLVQSGAEVSAYDRRTREELGADYEELTSLGVKLFLGEGYLDRLSGEIIFKTPGMRFDLPQLEAAGAHGAAVTSEMEVFFEVCPAKIIAVTGSDGKTTTTTILSKMLAAEGYKVWVGGNIGKPLLTEAEKMNESDIAVLELSSFQLHTMRKSPNIAVITNITPNHLDMHKSYEEYIEAKKNIMLYQAPGDRLVVNKGNEVTRKIGGEGKGEVIYFTSEPDTDGCGVYLRDGAIFRGDTEVLRADEIKIPGRHNIENYMAAIAALGDMVSDDTIRRIAHEFGGVEHRIEFVREAEGVKYYNSSIDSSPNRTANTLRVFPQKVILLAGGKDKGIPYDEIGKPIAEGVKILILVGATSDKLEKAVRDECEKNPHRSLPEIIRLNTWEDAVKTAHKKAKSGDIVLLSPASTSFDMFKNFEERGRLFKQLVNEL